MKFICTQSNLVRGLARVVPAAGRNKQLPILEHVLLRLGEGVLTLTATDLDVGIQATVPGKVEDEGVCTVPARSLYEYVQQLPSSEPLTLVQTKKVLVITTPGFTAKFPVGSDDEFPLLPEVQRTAKQELAGSLLCQALTNVLFSAAREEARPEIHGVFVQGVGDSIVVAATDSFRLAESVVVTEGVVNEFSFILPLAAAAEVVRLFSDSETVYLAPHDTHILLWAEGIEFQSRLVDGTYPNYRQIIPESFAVEGVIEREALVRALKTLLVFLPRDSRRVRMVVRPDAEEIVVSVGGGELGEGDVRLVFEGRGEELDILFNIQYLLDGLQRLGDEQVRVELGGNVAPAVWRPASEVARSTYVVMPIQPQ